MEFSLAMGVFIIEIFNYVNYWNAGAPEFFWHETILTLDKFKFKQKNTEPKIACNYRFFKVNKAASIILIIASTYFELHTFIKLYRHKIRCLVTDGTIKRYYELILRISFSIVFVGTHKCTNTRVWNANDVCSMSYQVCVFSLDDYQNAKSQNSLIPLHSLKLTQAFS